MDTASSDDEGGLLRHRGSMERPDSTSQAHVHDPPSTGRSCRGRGIRSESTVPIRPPPIMKPDKFGRIPMVSRKRTTEMPETYVSDEKKLNQFLSLHGMLSLDATSRSSLQMAIDLLPITEMETTPLPVVGKQHDDRFLRPCKPGERACCLGDRCLGRFLAKFRYGDETEYAVTLREFLLPADETVFLETGKLPVTAGKCLLCMRYFITYAYRLARTDVKFDARSKIPVFAYTNVVSHITAENLVQSSSMVSSTNDGYPSSALLGVDAEFSRSMASRKGMSELLVRPVVGFNSMDYTYVKDSDGTVRVIQDFHRASRGEGNPRLA